MTTNALSTIHDQRRWLLPLIIILLIAQQFLAVPGDTLFDRNLHNAFHFPWFFTVTMLLRLVFGAWLPAMLAALSLALVTEGVQLFTSREASAGDLARNAAGALAAWCVWIGVTARRWPFVLTAVGLGAMAFAPVAYAVVSKRYVHDQFPVLLKTEDARGRAYARATTEWSASADGIRITIDDSSWPGLHLTEPVRDWSGCATLNVELSLDDGPAVDLFVGLLLKPGDGITNFSLQRVEPGHGHVRVALAELLPSEGAPVHDVFIYTTGTYTGRSLTFHRVWLE